MVTSDGKVSTMAAELEKAGQQFQQLISYAGNAAALYGNPAFAYGSDQQQQNQTKMHGDTMQSPQADIQQFQHESFNQQSHNNPSAPPMYQQLNYDTNQEQQQSSYAENAADPYGNPAFAYGFDQQQQNTFMLNQAGMQGYASQQPQADFEQFQHGQQSHTNASAPPLYPQLDYDPNQELINYSDITNQMSDMNLRP
uniref:Mediator of RNA polymerase II transcription subunit 2 n=1 Tax=Globodera pallida TaxID=36090 RepID=A0A183C4S0_GLOPA